MSDAALACDAGGWPDALYDALVRQHVRQIAYVPDAGHSRLIERCADNPDMISTVLTTEEEGVALLAGAWLGGERGVLLMQSSGVGNCVNMFTLLENCRLPFVTIVTMRGEWGEFNPWQAAMGQATADILARMGIHARRIDDPGDAGPILEAAIRQSYDGMLASAVLLSQRLIGRKAFTEEG